LRKEADLREIVATGKKWGNDQVLEYVSRVRSGIERLMADSSVGRNMAERCPARTSLPTPLHFLFAT
jgi:plasmid stabilization system protein ParE